MDLQVQYLGARRMIPLLRVGFQTVIALMVTVACALDRAEAQAVAAVRRADTRTAVCTVPTDGQMLERVSGRLKLNPRRDLLRAEDLRIRPPLRTGDGLRTGGSCGRMTHPSWEVQGPLRPRRADSGGSTSCHPYSPSPTSRSM